MEAELHSPRPDDQIITVAEAEEEANAARQSMEMILNEPLSPISKQHRGHDIKAGDLSALPSAEKRKLDLMQAAAYLDDAFHARLKNGLGSTFYAPKIERLAFSIHASDWYKTSLKLVAFLYCGIIFVEAPSKTHHDWDGDRVLAGKLAELFCLLFLMCDFVLRGTYMGLHKIAEKGPLRILLAVEVICLIDVIVSLCLGPHKVLLRPFRCLRPLNYIIIDKHAMILVNLSIRALRALLPLVTILIVTLVMYSILMTNVASTAIWWAEENGWPFEYWVPFKNFVTSFVSLWCLSTFEPYVDFVSPFLDRREELIIPLISFVVVTACVMMNLMVAVQCDVFRTLQKELAASEEKKELKTMMMVFSLAKHPAKQTISYPDFKFVLQTYKPSLDDAMVDSLFSMVDKQGDKEIDVLEFADLCDILRLEHAISKGEVDASHSKLGGFGRLVQRTVSKNSNLRRNPDGIETINENWDFTTWLVTVVHSRWLRRFVATLILVDTIILACVHEGMDPDVMRAIRIADGVFVIILVLDDLFKIYVLSFATYWHDIWNRFSLVVVLISIVLIAFFPLIGLYLHKRLLMDHTAIRVQAIAGSIRAVKLLEFSASVQWYFTFLLKCYPVMFDFVVFFVGSAYSYGVIGLEVFHDTQEFDDVKNMVLTCLRILSMEGWHNIHLKRLAPPLYFDSPHIP
eukprot:c2456_g1_i2.p1 GENE.c2456_g1_i2~~c2456_g1_i2.p1  ORF type:complete len:738 (+),score=140.57 c2456_g1_i2:159-2216(+)